MIRSATIAVFLILATAVAYGDWSSCASDLNRLQRAARDASGHAESLEGKKSAVENAKSNFEDARDLFDGCRRDPDSYDSYSDRCETLRRRAREAGSEYEIAKNDYESELQQLQSELDSVRTYAKRLESSCADDNGIGTANPAMLCATLKKLKGQYADAELLAVCERSMPEAICRSCLGLK